jgi:transposase
MLDEMKSTRSWKAGMKMEVQLTEEQVLLLRSISRDKCTTNTIKKRAQILLALHGKACRPVSYHQIAEELNITFATLRNTISRYNELGFEQCMRHQRNAKSNAVPKVSREQEQALCRMAKSQPPEGYKKWTLRLLREKAIEQNGLDNVSVETVRQILRHGE